MSTPPVPDDVAFGYLAGREHDVLGTLYVRQPPGQPAWAAVWVELNLSMVELHPRPRYQLLPEQLIRAGLTRCRTLDAPPTPPGPLTWTVRLPRPAARAGTWTPGVYAWLTVGGRGRQWTIMAPLPPAPHGWRETAGAAGGRCAVYVTLDTHIVTEGVDPRAAHQRDAERLAAAANGQVYGTTAAVLA